MSKTDLFIIARRAPLAYETLKQRFASHPDIDVIVDRRHGERRRHVVPRDADRRVRQRRSMNIDGVLQQLGWVAVEQPEAAN